MTGLNSISGFFFIGIGGIGMSALARYFKMQGKPVYGYDRVETGLTSRLIGEGMEIIFSDSVGSIPETVKNDSSVLIVYTPAIGEDNRILNYFKTHGFRILKRAELLGEITRNRTCLAVAGTHGQTTTSAILAHLLISCNLPAMAFLGGITENYNSNFIYNGNSIAVVEADEYDRSFLHLHPDIACITNTDPDHLDVYENMAAVTKAFDEFAGLVADREKLLVRKGTALAGKQVGIEENADYRAENIRVENGYYVFDLTAPGIKLRDLQFHLPGHHNLANAVMALGMALLAGVSSDCLPEALASFKGVRRRFTYKINTDRLVLIDDYAHHPSELDALFQAVDEMYPGDRKQLVFQPHLYSRTRDFGSEFAASLARFDEVVLLDIYPAREKPIEGITSQWLLDRIDNKNKILVSAAELPEVLAGSSSRIKLMAGAGDIGAEVETVTKKLQKMLNIE